MRPLLEKLQLARLFLELVKLRAKDLTGLTPQATRIVEHEKGCRDGLLWVLDLLGRL
jgi:hypothetical protein